MYSSDLLGQEQFQVSLAGRLIDCVSLEDAVAIKAANDILTGDDPTPYSADQLAPITNVLSRYGFHRAAELLGGGPS
jgi:hypothetical protein